MFRTYTDLATMEGANEAARRAVNGILERSGSAEPQCRTWPLRYPGGLFLWFQGRDRKRLKRDQPGAFEKAVELIGQLGLAVSGGRRRPNRRLRAAAA